MPSMINEKQKIVYLHLSKTGGSWSRGILEQHDFKIIDIKSFGGHLPNSPKYKDYFTFGFVRHPVSWYKSLYRFFKTNDWVLNSNGGFSGAVFTDLKSDNINDFLDTIRRKDKFDLNEMYNRFFVEHPVSYIGKYENLYEDLHLCLKLNGINATNLIRNRATHYVNKSNAYDCNLSPENLEYIYDSCDDIFKTFNYKKDETE